MNLNTLYKKLTNRKYTIGYKFILSLFVGIIGIINFGYCEDELMYLENVFSYDFQGYVFDTYYQDDSVDMLCLKNKTCQYMELTYSANHTGTGYGTEQGNIGGLGFCTTEGIIYYSLSDENCSITINGYNFHKLSSNECQLEYNLIPISSIDTNYCVGNGFCPNECGGEGETTGTNRSSLFINNIQYPGASIIKVTIPEEIQREQNTDEEETNIDVIGYGYDQDKMQQMVNTQYYKPTAEEMSGLMEKVADFLPLVAVALLIIRIRRIIKKVF